MKSKNLYRILLVGGGTGGHFYPLIAIAEALRAQTVASDVYYAGPNSYDEKALATNETTFVWVPAGKRRRYASFQNGIDLIKSCFGLFVALIKLYIVYPDVVMSKGGYTSVPVILAAAFLRIPIVVHESDSVVGRANKIAIRFARAFVTSYENVAVGKSRAEVYSLGVPMRKELTLPPTSDAITHLGINPDRPVILVLGGSQGAERVNNLILDSLDELLKDFTIIHQTGAAHHTLCVQTAHTLIPDETLRANYHPVPLLDARTLNDAYHLASIVIARAGSGSIHEIALHGKPSILIPIPEEVSHDQRTNAYTYARTGAAIVLEEENLTDGLLRAEIDRMMFNQELYASMVSAAQKFSRADAAGNIAQLLMNIAYEHKNTK